MLTVWMVRLPAHFVRGSLLGSQEVPTLTDGAIAPVGSWALVEMVFRDYYFFCVAA